MFCVQISLPLTLATEYTQSIHVFQESRQYFTGPTLIAQPASGYQMTGKF